MKGTVVSNIWTDIYPINSQAQERLGYVTLVDDEDYEELSRFEWREQICRNGLIYARRDIREGKAWHSVTMCR
jgi:hypothetical protein